MVAVTDDGWFETLRRRPDLAEVNFWRPVARRFRALQPGELILFKLKAPRNAIAGGGIFAHSGAMPLSLAWEAFREANGEALRHRILELKADLPANGDFEIGCRILTQPFFLEEDEWIPVPQDFAPVIVSGKAYDTASAEGRRLWDAVFERVGQDNHFGPPRLVPPRLGQGAFRAVITDVYERRCAVTRERTLPVLDAAHIRPYGQGGAHEARNGLLLRRDLHKLFDDGYVTVTPEHRLEVSGHIRDNYGNGRDYYVLHGRTVFVPGHVAVKPDRAALVWHNENCFRG